jgi:hypothetical protein
MPSPYDDYVRDLMWPRLRVPNVAPEGVLWHSGGPVATKASIPALEVPAAPVEPQPEPESASVQMLRSLLADRRAERDRVNQSRDSRVKHIEQKEREIAELRTRIEQDDRHLTAADEAITAVIADIETLGGKA